MASQLEKRWRLVQTGLSFAVFGAVVLALAFVAIPASRWFARGREPEDLRAQRWIHRGARVFVGFLQGIGLARLERVGTARLRAGGPLLVVANHPTLFDLPLILSSMPQADCIVGAAWAENFFLRRVVLAAGYGRNDDGSSVIRACTRQLQAGRSVVIFPEGTRSPAGGLGAFQAGAAFVALRTGSELVPVLMSCDPPTQTKGRSWYDVPAGRLHVRVRVGEPVAPQPLRYRGVELAQAARRLTAELREVFLKGLDIAEVGSA
ncbi:MAG TPA: lysophospholipid acyltransferase family protein [Myxococcota bacterium]|jgi:1-acyl-sn-glycerol-3-phosphate acyltransferase